MTCQIYLSEYASKQNSTYLGEEARCVHFKSEFQKHYLCNED